MDNEFNERVTVRLFAGILITSEIRMHLNQNTDWKNAQIAAFHGSDDLIEVRHGKNEYIGCYLEGQKIQHSELPKFEKLTTDKLLKYCPRLPKSSCRFYVFSQLLIH
ncbi:MAG: hypothetical protein H0U49_04495 [Parachlamydiaceae bacterium]|nr:hypothetical protein [Parachlamydiaceae bacterium]